MEVRVRRLSADIELPSYAHVGDAGLDLRSAEDVTLQPGERALIGTGLAFAIPDGHAGFVLPRSGLALTAGLSLVNAPGLIDSRYRGELKIIAINLDRSEAIVIRRGDKIAQLVIERVESVTLLDVPELDTTDRGEGGFGSTGI
jgi:dUTP pyrophosphatase